MSTPPRGGRSRPTAGRRPARTGPGASRPVRTAPVAGRPEQAERSDSRSRRQGLTGRAAVLVLVVCALVVSAALPLRELFAQRGEISALEQEQAQAQARVDALEAEKARLGDPAYVAAEARRRLHFVLPGETSYVLVLPSPQPGAVDDLDAGEVSDEPWYSQVWGSVEVADAPPEPVIPAP